MALSLQNMRPLKGASYAAAAALLISSVGAQVTIDVSAVSNDAATAGDSTVFVMAGDTVEYSVVGQLGGDANQGLAMFALDLDYNGGALTQALEPAGGSLAQFVSPLGVNNPAGFGGTVVGGDLIQIGGAMNTIANTFAPVPSGMVATGIAQGGSQMLAMGSLTAPATPGTYVLSVSNVYANALDTMQPAGFWTVKPVEAAAPTALTVVVIDCGIENYCQGKLNSAGCVPTISATGSLAGGGSVVLTANDVVNGQTGLFVWSLSEGNMPLYGGTLCIGQPLFRMLEPLSSGGSGAPGTSCDGSYTRTIGAPFVTAAGLGTGDVIHCQWIYRDPLNSDGTGAGLTDGVRFTVCP